MVAWKERGLQDLEIQETVVTVMAFVVFAMEMAITDVEAIAGNRLEPQ